MAILTFYNHKGGVSKTTTTFNLGHLLASKGKRVLFVDADPQCNLTELCLGPLLVTIDAEMEASAIVRSLPGSTIRDALMPRISGEVAAVDIDSIETVSLKENIDLIRGDVELTTLEDDISEAHRQRFASRTNLMRTYVAIGDMLVRLGAERSYDYILVDLGPSAGAITRSFFLACDAFFVPVAADCFNVQAIKTLSKILEIWLDEHAQIRETYKSLSLPVRHGQPLFLGVVLQFFKVYKGRPKQGYHVWSKLILEAIENSLAPVLARNSTKERNLSPFAPNYLAAEIQDFGSLAPIMQAVGKAVFDLTPADTAVVSGSGAQWTGATWQDAEKRMNAIRECFENMAQRLEVVN